MKQAKKLLACAIIASTVVLPGCVTNPAKEKIKAYQQGMVFEDTFRIGNHELPLPERKWTYVGSQFHISDRNRPFGIVSLIKSDGKVLTDALLVMSALDQGGTAGYWSSSFCERRDLLYKEVRTNVEGKKQDCWGINYFVTARTQKTGSAARKTLEYIKKHRLEMPSFAVYSQHRLTEYGNFVEYQHATNPEYYSNVEPVPASSWLSSEWHVDRYYRDPQKVQYVDRVKRQAQKLHEKLKLGFAVN